MRTLMVGDSIIEYDGDSWRHTSRTYAEDGSVTEAVAHYDEHPVPGMDEVLSWAEPVRGKPVMPPLTAIAAAIRKG